MHVLDAATDGRVLPAPPDWVADWWMPEPSITEPQPDVDLPALLVPEPVIHLEVAGRELHEAATAV